MLSGMASIGDVLLTVAAALRNAHPIFIRTAAAAKWHLPAAVGTS
jgi:hypothetical protein